MLTWLFDQSMGVPGPHGDWPAWLSVLFHGSHAATACAFWAIPWVVSANWVYTRDGVTRRQYWTVMSLFVVMGARSFARVLEAWGPPYHLTVIIDVVAAADAMYVVPEILKLVLHVLKLPSRAEVHELADRLQVAYLKADLAAQTRKNENRKLIDKLKRYELRLASEGWTAGKASDLAEIRADLMASSWPPRAAIDGGCE